MSTVKTVSDSLSTTVLIAKPDDANSKGTIFGGRIMEWMDMSAAICARRHSNMMVSTVSVSRVRFYLPLYVGHIVHVTAKITRSFVSSMEVEVKVIVEDTYKDTHELGVLGYFTMVGLDDNGKPAKIPALNPQSLEEKESWNQAGLRRKQTTKQSK